MCRLVTTSCRRPHIEHGKDGLWRIVNEFGECLSVHTKRAQARAEIHYFKPLKPVIYGGRLIH